MSEDLVTDQTCFDFRTSARTIHFVSQMVDYPFYAFGNQLLQKPFTVKYLWQLFVATMVVPSSDEVFDSLASIIE